MNELVPLDDFDSAAPLVTAPRVNVDELSLRRHRKINEQAGWNSLSPRDLMVSEIVLIGGGPSIIYQTLKIRELAQSGAMIVTVNGSYDWAIRNSLWPGIQMIVDARASNARFVERIAPGCYFLMANHVHPNTLKFLPRDRTFLWDPKNFKVGTTVMTCAPAVLQSLGAKKFHFFGFDSCVFVDPMSITQHHAYTQRENDGEPLKSITMNDRTFRCTEWMLEQATDFINLSGGWGDFEVYGDGLIAEMLKAGHD